MTAPATFSARCQPDNPPTIASSSGVPAYIQRGYGYDSMGRLAATYTGSNDNAMSFSYGIGTVSMMDGLGVRSFYYDYHGLLAKTVDPLGNTTTKLFDNNLHLQELVKPTGESQSFTWCDCGGLEGFIDELGNTASFIHGTAFARLTSYNDTSGNTTIYNYNTNGHLISTVYPGGTIEQLSSYTRTHLINSTCTFVVGV